MKRFFMILLACMLLSGCTVTEQPAAFEETPKPTDEVVTLQAQTPEVQDLVDTVLYLPNEQVDGLIEKTVALPKQDIDALIAALVENGALPVGTSVRTFHATVEGGAARQGKLDLSAAYGDAVCGTGTAGEAMLLGSLVNTVLDAFGLDALQITCEGNILESGHAIYNEPLTRFSFDAAEDGPENAAFTALASDAAADVIGLIVNTPDAAALKNVSLRTDILPGEWELALVVPRYCGSHITLYAVDYTESADGTYEFVRGEVVFDDGATADGFGLYGAIVRPEGMPCYELVIQSGTKAVSYLFAYDGRDGVSPLELLTAQ